MPTQALRRAYRRIRLRLPQPWSQLLGRLAYLPRLAQGHEETRRGFAEEALIERLAGGSTPLDGIGAGLSERVVEVPWAFRLLASVRASRILDVGTAFSPIVYQRLLVRLPQTVELVDLADAWVPGLRTHQADVRALPFADDSYDAAVCISTLEHIGMDNAAYQVASGGGGDVAALRELGRVARVVLVTVPGGNDHDFGWQRQYSPQTFRSIATEAGLTVTRLETFAHEPGRGWAPVDEQAVTSRSYGVDSVNAAAVLCAQLTRASGD